MDDKIQLKLHELKNGLKEISELLLSKEFRVSQLKLLGDKLTTLFHEITINPLLRQYYAYQLFGFIFSYVFFVMFSLFTLISRYGFTFRIFFPHYLTLHWLILSIGVGLLLYKVNHYYHYQIVMREKLVANGEKGSADWANDTIHELSHDQEKLLKEQGLVTVPIHFRTLEELQEEKVYLENNLKQLKEQLEQEKTKEKVGSHESSE